MGIYIGTAELSKLYIGTQEVDKVYIGTEMVWQNTEEVNKPTELSPSGTYTGSQITNGYNCPVGVVCEGSASGTNVGTYSATYTPDSGHEWSDGTGRTPVTVTLTINRASVGAKPSNTSSTYTGEEITNGYTKPEYVSVTGDTKGTAAGQYTATYTPDSNHCWSDSTYSAADLVLTINRASVGAKPSTPSAVTYDGNLHTNGYTVPSFVSASGNASGTNAGGYTATYTPDSNHCWSDNTYTAVSVTLTINRASVGAKPTTTKSSAYTGSAISNGYSKPSSVSMTGNASGTNVGTYTAKYTPDSNHCWADGTYAEVTVTLTITKAANGIAVTTPQSIRTIYSGAIKSANITAASGANGAVTYSIVSGDTSKFSISGTKVTVNATAGTYSLTIRATAAGDSNHNSGYRDIAVTWTHSLTISDVSKIVVSINRVLAYGFNEDWGDVTFSDGEGKSGLSKYGGSWSYTLSGNTYTIKSNGGRTYRTTFPTGLCYKGAKAYITYLAELTDGSRCSVIGFLKDYLSLRFYVSFKTLNNGNQYNDVSNFTTGSTVIYGYTSYSITDETNDPVSLTAMNIEGGSSSSGVTYTYFKLGDTDLDFVVEDNAS